MDPLLAEKLRVGDRVLYYDALHTVVAVAPYPWPPTVILQGPYATDSYVSYELLYFPVLVNPPEKES